MFVSLIRCFCALVLAVTMAGISPVHAQERPVVTLAAPQTLIDTGLLTYMLPRFTLKHRIRVTVVPETETAPLAMIANTGGKPLFEGAGTVWHLALSGAQNDDHTTLVNWLTSDIGLNTVEAFAGQEGLRFTRAAEVVQVAEALDLTGDAANGLMVSNLHCKRCHVVGKADRMSGIGSTPSFFVLRAFPDWDERFYAFYALNPHPSFTRILDLDTTLDPQRKAAIVPLDLSLEELDDIVTYVAGLTPADLGAPIQLQ